MSGHCEECGEISGHITGCSNEPSIECSTVEKIYLYSSWNSKEERLERHPNDKTPVDADCSAVLDLRGDNVNQGLNPYWKWGFREGWKDHKNFTFKENILLKRTLEKEYATTISELQRELEGALTERNFAVADKEDLEKILRNSIETNKVLHYKISRLELLASERLNMINALIGKARENE